MFNPFLRAYTIISVSQNHPGCLALFNSKPSLERRKNLYHYGFRNLLIGSRCFVGDEAMLDMRGKIILEDDVTLSNRCNIVTHMNVGYKDHPLQKLYPTKESMVKISKGAYIGTGAIVLPGVTVGRKSVVGAGSVVTKNVPANTVVGGVPAKVIKRLRLVKDNKP